MLLFNHYIIIIIINKIIIIIIGFDEYLDGFDEDSFEESDEEEKMLAVDPDFASCGTKWLDKDDSCHRSIQIASQRAKCRHEEAHAMLLKTPLDA